MDISTIAQLTTAAIIAIFAAAKSVIAVIAYFKKVKKNG